MQQKSHLNLDRVPHRRLTHLRPTNQVARILKHLQAATVSTPAPSLDQFAALYTVVASAFLSTNRSRQGETRRPSSRGMLSIHLSQSRGSNRNLKELLRKLNLQKLTRCNPTQSRCSRCSKCSKCSRCRWRTWAACNKCNLWAACNQ